VVEGFAGFFLLVFLKRKKQNKASTKMKGVEHIYDVYNKRL